MKNDKNDKLDKNEKKEFVPAEMEIIEFDVEDVLTVSNEGPQIPF